PLTLAPPLMPPDPPLVPGSLLETDGLPPHAATASSEIPARPSTRRGLDQIMRRPLGLRQTGYVASCAGCAGTTGQRHDKMTCVPRSRSLSQSKWCAEKYYAAPGLCSSVALGSRSGRARVALGSRL